ncbi:nuclear transport factor 2 family protein [Flavobacterium sp. NST-5]|uniref:Nuclear transport factor 2 family protein n=1 Tax=Flavobacterium ichthyis TaxID=2698827 RepID=A0ABW9ZCV5_9FLAO|nr:nuclear transport factor 2 family protein [Flavobacterium ichthyis]NBL65599.1 nuclear transport factor 2 family protein [Flavobacterium ichthyis]
MKNRELIINNYIDGYNEFNIDKMVADLDDTIIFENIQGGETNLVITGLEDFKEQAEKAATYFSERTQTISSIQHSEKTTEIEINYNATLRIDLENGMKKGQQINLKGISIFEFQDGKIIRLTDKS